MTNRRNTKRAGFTMIELMAALVILSLLAAGVAAAVWDKVDKARKVTTMASLKVIHNAVLQFRMDTGRFPSEEEGLEVLISSPNNANHYLESKQTPTDSWGTPYIYVRNPESGGPFCIISLGANKEEGGEGIDADLYSTDTM